MPDSTRIVSAAVFLAWWDRLAELSERNPHDAAVRALLRRLAEAGRPSGATHVRDNGGSPPNPPTTPLLRNPAFDWDVGEIAMGPARAGERVIGAPQLIAELTLATGIAAHDASL